MRHAISLKGTRVLIVDDNRDACELMKMFLETMAGCTVSAAYDGGEALRITGERQFDVAVLDIGLPVLDGYQVAASIVEHLGSHRPRLIALTGYDREEDRGRAQRAGFDAHLAKLREEMRAAAANLDFEKAAALRDEIKRLRNPELGLPRQARRA